VLTVPPGPTIVRLGAGTGVVLKGRSYGLAGSLDPLAAGARGAEMSVVARKSLGVYSSTTWKSLAQLDTEESRAAVFDAKRGRFYLSRGEELRVWDGAKENQDRAIEGVSGRFHALALDGGAARVYGVEKEKLRSWRVKD
jgi:hypothetical protein